MSLYQVPILGPWAYKTGHVIDIVSSPCDPTPTIMVKAFWHAAPYLVWSLIKPDPVDFLTQRFGQPHKRRRRWLLNTVDWQGAKDPTMKGLGWAAFTGIRLVERVGWYILVVDASIDFGVHWTSAAWQWSGCRVPGSPYYRGGGIPGNYGPYAGGEYTLAFWAAEQEHIFAGDSDSVATPAGYWTSAGAQIVCGEVPPILPKAAMGGFKIVDTISGETSEDFGFQRGHGGKLWASAAIKNWDAFQPGRNYCVRFTKSDGYWNCQEASFIASGTKERPIERDP